MAHLLARPTLCCLSPAPPRVRRYCCCSGTCAPSGSSRWAWATCRPPAAWTRWTGAVSACHRSPQRARPSLRTCPLCPALLQTRPLGRRPPPPPPPAGQCNDGLFRLAKEGRLEVVLDKVQRLEATGVGELTALPLPALQPKAWQPAWHRYIPLPLPPPATRHSCCLPAIPPAPLGPRVTLAPHAHCSAGEGRLAGRRRVCVRRRLPLQPQARLPRRAGHR